VQLRGFFDAPLWVDVAPYDATRAPLVNQTQSVFALTNATGRSGATCGALYGTTPASPEAWKCLYGAFRLPTVHTQWLASAPQFDADQLVYDVGSPPPYTGAQLSYADIFQRNVRSAVMQLPSAQQGGSAVYSSACFGRCTSVSGQFGQVTVDGISLKEYLGDWYFGGPLGNRPQVVEACAGFGCGACRAPPGDVAPAPPLPPARAGLYAPPGPVPSPPGFTARLAARARTDAAPAPPGHAGASSAASTSDAGTFSGSHLLIIAILAFLIAAAVRILASRTRRTMGDRCAGVPWCLGACVRACARERFFPSAWLTLRRPCALFLCCHVSVATSFEMQRNAETAPLLRAGSLGRAGGSAGAVGGAPAPPRPGFSSPSLPPGIRVTKVAPVGRG
jgi:hypothetical protein